VLERRDFVEAAPTLPADPRLRLPPASPHRHDGREIEVFHLHSDNQRLVAHVSCVYPWPESHSANPPAHGLSGPAALLPPDAAVADIIAAALSAPITR